MMTAAAATVVMLFVSLTAPDGSKQFSDLAVVRDAEVCGELASELNKSPRKPAELTFGCRPVQEVVRTSGQ